jgi:hypothetical protein
VWFSGCGGAGQVCLTLGVVEQSEPRVASCYPRAMKLQGVVGSALVAMVSLGACQLSEQPPAETPPSSPPPLDEPAPLPPEETPPPEPVAPAPANPPEAKPVDPGISMTGAPTRGTLPKAVVDEKLQSAQPGISACYQRALQSKPALRGSVDVTFVVGTDGKVAHIDAAEGDGALPDAEAVRCILQEIQKLEFPPPRGGRVFLSYPLKLEPPAPGAK